MADLFSLKWVKVIVFVMKVAVLANKLLLISCCCSDLAHVSVHFGASPSGAQQSEMYFHEEYLTPAPACAKTVRASVSSAGVGKRKEPRVRTRGGCRGVKLDEDQDRGKRGN